MTIFIGIHLKELPFSTAKHARTYTHIFQPQMEEKWLPHLIQQNSCEQTHKFKS